MKIISTVKISSGFIFINFKKIFIYEIIFKINWYINGTKRAGSVFAILKFLTSNIFKPIAKIIIPPMPEMFAITASEKIGAKKLASMVKVP